MKNIQKIHRVLYAIGLGPDIGGIIALLTTTGRKSGKKRVTPLQYEKIGDDYYLGAARGLNADWVRNIQSNPEVELRVGAKHLQGTAEIITDPSRLADFIEVRPERHPLMIGLNHGESTRIAQASQPRAVGRIGWGNAPCRNIMWAIESPITNVRPVESALASLAG